MNRMTRNSDDIPNIGHPLGGKKLVSIDQNSQNQAHGYILFNCDEVQEYIREHEVDVYNPRKRRRRSKATNQREDFIEWFEARVMNEEVSEWIKVLSRGPNNVCRRFFGYVINGYMFHTRAREARLKTQNSGVTLESLSFRSEEDGNSEKVSVTFYGTIKDIIELDYYGHAKYVLFKCDWFVAEEDKYGLKCVYFNKKCYKNDPFVLASQVQQCFYIEDPHKKYRHYVLKALPRDSFDMGESSNSDGHEYENSNLVISKEDCEVDLVRKDIPDDIFEKPHSELYLQQKGKSIDDEGSCESEDETTDGSSCDDST